MDEIKIRVIDSKKLIEAINTGSYEINLSAVMALGAVVTQSASQWIPCSEKLPEEADGTVLVCMPNESPYNEREQFINAKHNQQVETAHYSQHSDTWYFAMGAVSETRPIAWMPLPEPYREEKNA